jgi:hypothetical protein
MKTDIFKTNIISFTYKNNSIHFNYFLCDLLIVNTDCVKGLGVMLESKLHFHRRVECLHSQALKLLGPIYFIAYNFSSLDSLKVLYITLIRSKLEYASVVWNKLTSADYNKLENIQRKFGNLCYNRFIQPNSFCNYESMLNYLHFKTLYFRRQNLDAINFFKNKIDCCSIMDTTGLGVRTKQIGDFSTCNVSNVSRLSPSTRCVTAASNICESQDVFNKHNISFEDTFPLA